MKKQGIIFLQKEGANEIEITLTGDSSLEPQMLEIVNILYNNVSFKKLKDVDVGNINIGDMI